MLLNVIKKDGTLQQWKPEKIITAVKKSAQRVLYELNEHEMEFICKNVKELAEAKASKQGKTTITVPEIHNMVEIILEQVNSAVAKSYRDYRDYKTDFVGMLDEVYKKSQSIMYIGDKENSNTDSALVSTKRSLIFNQLNKELYKKFFLTTEELQACRDGYIYVHDMSARRDTMNCCLFDMAKVLKDGFEIADYTIKKTNEKVRILTENGCDIKFPSYLYENGNLAIEHEEDGSMSIRIKNIGSVEVK